jgi:hypothetical protein
MDFHLLEHDYVLAELSVYERITGTHAGKRDTGKWMLLTLQSQRQNAQQRCFAQTRLFTSGVV